MRAGVWDIHARVHDMDINGDYASVNFPSFLAGFSGQRFQLGHDPDLALAVVRAWNDFIIEEWAGAYPDRIIPLQLPWLLDPAVGGDEIRANAERGFKAVTFSEAPERLGFRRSTVEHWDPLLQACEETETVVCLHFGSSGTTPQIAPDAPPEVLIVLFGMNIAAALDWVYSRVPARFPDIKLCLSEGGVGRVPPLLDRLDHVMQHLRTRDVRHVPQRRMRSGRAPVPQLLVLCDRRTVGDARPRANRRGSDPPRDRLPPRRLHLARHPDGGRPHAARPAAGSHRAHHVAERIRALPTPSAPHCPAGPRGRSDVPPTIKETQPTWTTNPSPRSSSSASANGVYWLADQPIVRGVATGTLDEDQLREWTKQFFVTVTRIMRFAQSLNPSCPPSDSTWR